MPAPDASLGLGIETGGTGSRWCLSAPSGMILARGEMEPMTGHVFTQTERDRVSGIFARLASEVDNIGHPAAIVAEGRFEQPEQLETAFAAGAHSVVVGTAITNPREITRRFARHAGA